VGGTCSANGGEVNRIQVICGKARWKEATRKTKMQVSRKY
jgi:hypothetical protein